MLQDRILEATRIFLGFLAMGPKPTRQEAPKALSLKSRTPYGSENVLNPRISLSLSLPPSLPPSLCRLNKQIKNHQCTHIYIYIYAHLIYAPQVMSEPPSSSL